MALLLYRLPPNLAYPLISNLIRPQCSTERTRSLLHENNHRPNRCLSASTSPLRYRHLAIGSHILKPPEIHFPRKLSRAARRFPDAFFSSGSLRPFNAFSVAVLITARTYVRPAGRTQKNSRGPGPRLTPLAGGQNQREKSPNAVPYPA